MSDAKRRYYQARRVTLISALINLFLAIIKLIFGGLGRSHALIADGAHSLSDLLTDALVLIASRFGSRQADLDHPYGHQRIETAATLFLALLLILAGVGIAYDSLMHLIKNNIEYPKFYVLIVACISIIANEGLFHYTLKVGKQINSKLVIANAWHHRSDAASSVVVLIGVAGALFGFAFLDACAAIIVGAMIVKMGWSLGWNSVQELVDRGVDPDILEKIKEVIMSVPGVVMLHQLRTRCMADNILVDAHVLVDPKISVSEGHYIAEKVYEKLLQTIEKMADVVIHVDPENDEQVTPSSGCPPRDECVPILLAHWINCPGVEEIQNIQLHYLNGKIDVEITLPLTLLENGITAEAIYQRYLQSARSVKDINDIKIVYQSFKL